MPTQNLNFGGGAADTAVSPIILAIVLVAGVLICIVPRRKAIAVFLSVGILVPLEQVFVFSGMHFPMPRLLAVFGLARLAWTKISGKDTIFSGGINGIDWAFMVMTVFTLIDGVLLWRSQAEFIYQAGNLIMALGVYLLARHLIQEWDDVRQALKVLAFVTVPIAALMVYECSTGTNPYYALIGGAQNFSTALDRAGGIRARGVFAHPILAGTFGGFMLPLFIGWWWKDKEFRKRATLGVASAAIIPFLAGSSTALFALLGGVGALCLWPMRRMMKPIRWGVVAFLVAAQMCMKSPVWHLISDVSLSGDSSSYHRYMLVDQCIRHFWSWSLIGTTTFASWGWDMWDLSNQYVGVADTSGLVPLIALIAIIVYGFKYVGRMRKQIEGNDKEEWFIWAMGASLFANFVAFWGISYFDQTIVPWYALLAIISTMTLAARKPAEERAKSPAGVPAAQSIRPATGLAKYGLALAAPKIRATGRSVAGPAAKDTPGKNWMLEPRETSRRP